MGPNTAQITEHSVVSSLTLQNKYAEFWDSQPELPLGLLESLGTCDDQHLGEEMSEPRLSKGEGWMGVTKAGMQGRELGEMNPYWMDISRSSSLASTPEQPLDPCF